MRMKPGGLLHVDFSTVTAGGAPLGFLNESKVPLVTSSASNTINSVAATIAILYERFTGPGPSST